MELLRTLYESHPLSHLHLVLIFTHITLGLIALLLGPVAMRAHKGGKNHRRAGKIYFWSMTAALLVAVVLLFFRFNVFLAGITALSLNGVVTGYRSLRRKRPQSGNGPAWFDWAFATVFLFCGFGLLGYGILTGAGLVAAWIPSGDGMFAILVILPIVFGVFILNDAITDIRILRTPPTDRNWWWYYHMSRMLGSYIALVTALMVQQVGPLLPGSVAWFVWIAPAAIGSPLIARWIGLYRRQFDARTAPIVTTTQSQPAHNMANIGNVS